MSMADKRRSRPIDISTSGKAPGPSWISTFLLWILITVSLAVFFYFDINLWLYVLFAAAVVVAIILWRTFGVLRRRGVFTWMRLAQTPSKLMASGDAVGAQAAFERARARANQFAATDQRRGMMLCELAMYLKNQGHAAESLAMYEESASILAQHLASDPLDYFIVLNNYAICFIHLRDFEAAQKLLEKALDLTLTVRKHEATSGRVPLQQVQWLQFVLHLNLGFLFLEMRELGEADAQLREADALAPLLSKRNQQTWQDHYIALCAIWELESGNVKAAGLELDDATNPDYPACLRTRARVALACKKYADANELLEKFLQDERKKGSLHRPELYKTMLDRAECLFGLGKHEEAFAALAEARSIVADFQLPMDSFWRGVLQTWLQRVDAFSQTNLAASIRAELERMPTVDTAIVVMDRLRSRQI
ncbi:MAG TPA: tetratricopeptide repeat protein [Gemmataceae bacterium]|nr:tetratricopeptide repeat protein [Gemmataceae bacterium]